MDAASAAQPVISRAFSAPMKLLLIMLLNAFALKDCSSTTKNFVPNVLCRAVCNAKQIILLTVKSALMIWLKSIKRLGSVNALKILPWLPMAHAFSA